MPPIIEFTVHRSPDDSLQSVAYLEDWRRAKFDYIMYEPAGAEESDEFRNALVLAKAAGIRVIDFVTYYAAVTGRVPLELVTSEWLLMQRPYNTYAIYSRFRRMLDLFCGGFLLLCLFVPIGILLLFVYFSSGSPVIFVQERLGRFRVPFRLYKLRTMIDNAEPNGPQWATREDSRETQIGKILRRTHLDEVPQLVNLVKGEITLIGPRPIRKHFADVLEAELPWYATRFLVKPGLTGFSQVLGPYGSNKEEQKIKLEMELCYIFSASVFLDLYILMKTLQLLLREIGALITAVPLAHYAPEADSVEEQRARQ